MKINRDQKTPQDAVIGVSGPFRRGKKRRYFKLNAFVLQYLVDLNPLQAWRRCGYATGNTTVDSKVANDAYKRADVQQAIYELQQKQLQSVEITQQQILAELICIAMSDITNVMAWSASGGITLASSAGLPKKYSACIRSIKQTMSTNGAATLSVELYDKKAALIDLGKHLGMFWQDSDRAKDPEEEAFKIQKALQELEKRTNPKAEA